MMARFLFMDLSPVSRLVLSFLSRLSPISQLGLSLIFAPSIPQPVYRFIDSLSFKSRLSYVLSIFKVIAEMGVNYQEVIEDITMTIDDYDEYCYYDVGLFGLGLSKLFHASGIGILFPDSIFNSVGLFLQIMIIGTLALCYNNIEVFKGVVKMRRG
ncbi:Terpenoid synthase [Cynara cardunculus var. scolymus]|uniref:Terpenoid synthase n=1 Tax=Cynara cardunculus var. scolymus TaxID=59895 RepID=A0A103Y3A2_CYNCS|nr:Terpenoid synthase [Cynara cardunculus var. scolymus]